MLTPTTCTASTTRAAAKETPGAPQGSWLVRAFMRPLRERERGSYSLQLAVVAMALLAVAMFTIDQSSKIRAARNVETSAQEAARAAAQQLQPGIIQGEAASVDPAKAAAAARAYLRAAGVEGSVRVSGTQIRISTSTSWSPTVLQLVGVSRSTLSSDATVRIASP